MKHRIWIMTALLAVPMVCAPPAEAGTTATFTYFSYTGNDARFNKTIDRAKEYFNPILAGFYPDPSVCRVGETYYLVNSSFAFFPGVPIFTSHNLTDWRQIGFVLDRPSQLPLKGQGVSAGIFAPDIKYNPKNKTFYMITTNIGAGNFFVRTTDPAKGWSEPIYLPKVRGIDPSFFFDKDGRGYIVNNDEPKDGHVYDGERSIKLHYFDVKGDSVVGDEVEIVRSGTHVEKEPIWIEGPHLYRIGKYYYLMCAEGGTGDWHSEVIFRAKKPEGPWEEYADGNPILTQRYLKGRHGDMDPRCPDADTIVTSTGHADLVSTPQGDWYAVFLGCRPYEGGYYNTGRDTYLLPVTWNEGWPTILPKDTAVPVVAAKPSSKRSAAISTSGDSTLTGNFTYTDRFDSGKLNMRWLSLRERPTFYSLGADGLTITPKAVNIGEKKSPSALFTRQQHNDFSAETRLSFTPKSDKDLAGLVLLQNEQYNFVFGKTIVDGEPAVVVNRSEKSNVLIAMARLDEEDSDKPLELKVRGDGRYYSFYYRTGDGDWQTLARGVDGINLSTARSDGFIGDCIGLYATTNNI